MDIYQLRYFLAVAETQNFTKAAQRSFISQPSLSQQILNLEEELGQKLFQRLGRKAVLTEAGNILLERTRRILTEVEQTVAELKAAPELGPKVAVGAIPTVAPFFLPAVVAYCRANDIRINLQTYEDFSNVIIDQLIEGKLDWALLSSPITDPRLLVQKLYSEPLLIALCAGNPLAEQDQISFNDLREENFILLGENSTLTHQIKRYCGEHEFEPIIAHRCGQVATVKSLVSMGLGISILPQSARSATDPVGLVFKKLSGVVASRDICLVRHHRRHLGQGGTLFAEAAQAVVGPMPANVSTAPFKSEN
jgi:LysR family hydrogen peroxide-inducible transcriptional activator